MNKKFKKNLKQKREYQKQYRDIKRKVDRYIGHLPSIVNDIAREIICDRTCLDDSILECIPGIRVELPVPFEAIDTTNFNNAYGMTGYSVLHPHKSWAYLRPLINEQVEHLKRATNIVRPPVDYIGVTEVRPDLLSLFVKPEGE